MIAFDMLDGMRRRIRRELETVVVSSNGRGGIRSVVEQHQNDGLFERWNGRLLISHTEGSARQRTLVAAQAYLQFAVLLASRSVGLVHCHVASRGSFLRKSIFAELARLAKVPVIFHLHGAEMREFVARRGRLGLALITRELDKATVVVVLSESWREFVLGIAPSANVLVLPNYVELPSLEQQRNDGLVRVLFLGILGDRKGIFDLLRALQRAIQTVPALRLIIAGNGETERVENEVARLGLEKYVELVGWVSGERKRELLRTSSVFALPSYNEGLPVSLLEAMAYGIPVISTRVGGIPELVRSGEDGVLISAGDVAALSDALVRLASDASVRDQMGRSARLRVADTYSQAAVLPRLEQIYEDLTSR